MIFKIAHICFCGNHVKARELLAVLGYELVFSERIPPMGITQRHLSQYITELDMSLWAKQGNISIEILEFENYSHNKGLICPLVSAKMPGVVAGIAEEHAFQFNTSEYQPAAFIECPAYIKLDASIEKPLPDTILDTILIFTHDLSKSLNYWSLVGLDCIERSNIHAVFRLRCVFTGKNFYVHVHKTNQNYSMTEDIDSLGFHVLGLISNSAKLERERLVSFGINVTPLEQISINGRSLSIFYSRSPEGIITEIISLNQVSIN